jgi:hypothetical protein
MQSDKHINNLKEIKANPNKKIDSSENELSTDNFDADSDNQIQLEKHTNLDKLSDDEVCFPQQPNFLPKTKPSNGVMTFTNGKSAHVKPKTTTGNVN